MADKKVRITDIAEAAGVSQSTASFVLAGRGDRMKIRKDTQDLVWAKARELGYRPCNQAKRMRTSRTSAIPTITVFWNAGREFVTLARAFNALQHTILDRSMNVQFVMKPFLSGQLSAVLDNTASNYFNGAIIGGATPDDIEAVEKSDIRTPIVFFERDLPEKNSVCTNPDIGGHLAPLFQANGFKRVQVLLPNYVETMIAARLDSLRSACRACGIDVRQTRAGDKVTNLEAGRRAVLRLMKDENRPDVLVFMQEEQAISGIDALRSLGLMGGRDVELVVFSTGDHLDYLGMPLTRIKAATAALADQSIDLLLRQIENPTAGPQNVKLEAEILHAGRLMPAKQGAKG